MRVLKTMTALVLLLAFAFWNAFPAFAAGQDTPTFGVSMHRTRRIWTTSSVWGNGLLFNPKPKFLDLGSNLASYTEPVTANGIIYQYAFDPWGTNGYLFLDQESATGTLSPIPGGGYWSIPAGTIQNAGAVSGPTISQGYVAIAVGQYVWVWPVSDTPTSPAESITNAPGVWKFQLPANPGNTDYQDSMSPAITPTVQVQAYNALTGRLSAPYKSPVVAAGGWAGGFGAYPVLPPPGYSTWQAADVAGWYPSETLGYNEYLTTQTSPSSTLADITSSPAYAASGFAGIGTSGNGALLFGVSGVPGWMVAIDPTGAQPVKTFGNGEFGPGGVEGISSSPVLTTSHNLYVPSNGGGIVEFNQSGAKISSTSSRWFGGIAQDISDVALGSNYVYAMESNRNQLVAFARHSLASEGQWSPGSGQVMYNPSLVFNGPTAPYNTDLFIGSNSGSVYDLAFHSGGSGSPTITTLGANSGSCNSGGGFLCSELTGDSGLPAYDAVTADTPPARDVMTWGSDPHTGAGAIIYWTPASYTVAASFNQTTVTPSQTVTLTAKTSPGGLTSNGLDSNSCPSTGSPAVPGVEVTNSSSFGDPSMVPTGISEPCGSAVTGGTGTFGYSLYSTAPGTKTGSGTWQVQLTAPKTPGTYTVNVNAVDKVGQTATATATLTVRSISTVGGVCTTNFAMVSYATWRNTNITGWPPYNYMPPAVRLNVVGKAAATYDGYSGYSPFWTVQQGSDMHWATTPNNAAVYHDQVVAQMNVTGCTPPAGTVLVDYHLAGPGTVTHPVGYHPAGLNGPLVTKTMTTPATVLSSSNTLKTSFPVSWGGYPHGEAAYGGLVNVINPVDGRPFAYYPPPMWTKSPITMKATETIDYKWLVCGLGGCWWDYGSENVPVQTTANLTIIGSDELMSPNLYYIPSM